MDLTSPKVIALLQKKFNFGFSKDLGQNFLTNEDVLYQICDSARGAEGIIEIGPGFGVLSAKLCENFPKVVAIELDKRLPEVLQYTLADYDNFKLYSGDVLKLDLNAIIKDEFSNKKVSICANLPYYITTPILTGILSSGLPVDNIVIMVQKEVAERICAAPGCKDYGALTLMCKYYSNPKIIAMVSKDDFVPSPKVDSAVVALNVCKKPTACVKSREMFFRVVKAGFSQRRKTLLNCLISSFSLKKDEIAGILGLVNIDLLRRGETLSIEEYAALSDIFYEKSKENVL